MDYAPIMSLYTPVILKVTDSLVTSGDRFSQTKITLLKCLLVSTEGPTEPSTFMFQESCLDKYN